MVKAVVVYDTEFGNTERIAKVLAEGMREQGVDVECVELEEVEIDKLTEHDLLVIGGPTHMHNISKPVKELLEKLETADVRGMKAFAFDTRAKRAFAESAAKRVETRLKRLQMSIIRPYSSALVKKRGGPLEEDMEKMFKHISAELADLVQQQSSSELEIQLDQDLSLLFTTKRSGRNGAIYRSDHLRSLHSFVDNVHFHVIAKRREASNSTKPKTLEVRLDIASEGKTYEWQFQESLSNEEEVS